jgi:tRNA pseudouridine55 synthase
MSAVTRHSPAECESTVFLDVNVRVSCSSGTYIRALARDLGAKLGVGAHLTMLRRERVGTFDVSDATSARVFERATPPKRRKGNDETPAESLYEQEARKSAAHSIVTLSPARAATELMPTVQTTDEQSLSLGNGKRIELPQLAGAYEQLAAIDPQQELVAIIAYDGKQAKILTGFPPPQQSTQGAS